MRSYMIVRNDIQVHTLDILIKATPSMVSYRKEVWLKHNDIVDPLQELLLVKYGESEAYFRNNVFIIILEN